MNLFRLQWKATFRSPQWEAKLSIKIIMGFLIVYFGGAFVLGASVIYPILFKTVLDREPLEVFNSVLLYVLFFELGVRFLLQQLPVTNIQTLILLPLSKGRVIRHILFKSVFSSINLTPLIIYLPFAISMYRDDYLFDEVFAWWSVLLLLTLCLNFLTFLVNKSNWFFWTALVVMVLVVLGDYYDLFYAAKKAGVLFDLLVQHPSFWWTGMVPLILTYGIVFRYLKRQFYLDKGLSVKKEQVRQNSFSFVDKLGQEAFLIKNDLRMIARNARPRQVMVMVALFLFYGLIFFTQEIYRDMTFALVFAALFVTGGFTMTFGNYVPAWDSSYYPLLMTQNISYKDYLLSKWNLMAFMTFLAAILSTPYLYFGANILLLIWACSIFTIGVGTWITLAGGLLNKTPMKLNAKAKAFDNTQAFSMTQFLLVIPKLVLPVMLYGIPAALFNEAAGIFTLTSAGILGIVLRQKIAAWITRWYIQQKYATIAAFNQSV